MWYFVSIFQQQYTEKEEIVLLFFLVAILDAILNMIILQLAKLNKLQQS